MNPISVACPKCGHSQPEPPGAYSTICKKCRAHFRIDEALRPVAKPQKTLIELRQVRCFQCGAELEVPLAATSTMCKHCSSHLDLNDYAISQTISKNFRTHGRLAIESGAVVVGNIRIGPS